MCFFACNELLMHPGIINLLCRVALLRHITACLLKLLAYPTYHKRLEPIDTGKLGRVPSFAALTRDRSKMESYWYPGPL